MLKPRPVQMELIGFHGIVITDCGQGPYEPYSEKIDRAMVEQADVIKELHATIARINNLGRTTILGTLLEDINEGYAQNIGGPVTLTEVATALTTIRVQDAIAEAIRREREG